LYLCKKDKFLKFSIITVNFNGAKTLEQTIQSVLAQDYKDLEYIVIDGGSKDDSVKILEKYKNCLTYISEKDAGIYDALNKGLKMATGEIIGCIGSDDFYPSNDVISEVANAFNNQKTKAIYGDKQFVNADNISKVVRYWTAGHYNIENWLEGWMPPHLSFYLKKESYEKYGYYITDFTCSGDYELMLRMLFKNNVTVAYLPKVLMTMRNGGTSTASWKHRIKANKEDRMAWKINGLSPRWYTLWWKPISKISQLFKSK
jgi:glycosyltransferase involved in cell wall biosynthesis